MNKIYHFLLAAIAATTIASCSSDEAMPEAQDIQMPREWRFKMDVEKPQFDGDTRATDAGWEQGDSLFLRFTKSSGYAYGVAVYAAETGDWVIKDAPSVDLEETKKLELAFFNGSKTVSGQTVTLSPTTAVYTDDGNGTYLLTMANNFVPVIKGHLVPRTGRLRFKGEVGTTVIVSGLKHNKSFNTSTFAATTTTDAITLTVGSDGYTPYTYCTFASNDRVLSVAQDITVGTNGYRYTFTATCPSTMLQTGKSGWMNLPTYNSHDGWEMKAEALSVTPAKTSVEMSCAAGSETISMESNIIWTATSSASWLTATKKSNTELTLTATANTSDTERTATVSIKDEKGTVKATISVKQKSNKINGHEYVDLGLPSGLLWATCNVGASKPEDYGNYYAWGETSTKSDYSSSTSTTYGKTTDQLKSAGIIGNDGNLTSAYDAATKAWGGTWRMPTLDEIKELIDNTTTTWTTQNGVNGRKVTSKKNGNSIFLPAAGYRYGASLDFAGSYGRYWSSSPDTSGSYYACGLSFYSSDFGWAYDGRYFGRSVRPVSEP